MSSGRILAVSALVVLATMAAGANPPPANIVHGCTDRYDPSADYFPDKLTLDDARNFTVEYQKSYKVVTVRHVYAAGPAERYVLVQCGTPAPALTGPLAGAQVVPVPIASAYLLSATNISALVDLNRVDVLTGVADLEFVTLPAARARIAQGKVTEFAKSAASVDIERVAAGRPSLLLSGGTPNQSFAAIRAAGVPVAANTDWLEPTALGRAEWLKYVALWLNEERRANEVFRDLRERYQRLSVLANSPGAGPRPLVMTGRSTKGTFVIAGGQSYVAALIRDAGAQYAWADNAGVGSLSVDLEAQITRAAGADYWINGGGWKNLAAMLDDEPRYSAFKAYRNGQVWTYERQQTSAGVNDYWSRSVTHPEIVLADLVKIFHPAVAADHRFEWYMRVPGAAAVQAPPSWVLTTIGGGR